MSSSTTTSGRARLPVTNLTVDELIMDTRGLKDARYYCLPRVYGKAAKTSVSGGYPLHLVGQGHKVGVFHSWLEAKSQLTGYPDSSNRGYHTMDECVEAWQGLCDAGLHPHPVNPTVLEIPSAAPFVNASPRKSGPTKPVNKNTPVKREAGGSRDADAQVLADLKRYCRPIVAPPPPAAPPARALTPPSINFAIRGGGIVSSSAHRSRERYLELQRRGEEPDMLVTRSLGAASLFALDDDEVEDLDLDN
ncbi:hypothetical protein C8R46DRAFT_1214017 [Mycena filopes]|nr:hypothetical protein C8R46DRAFT_1214017 [Mycena filopes]